MNSYFLSSHTQIATNNRALERMRLRLRTARINGSFHTYQNTTELRNIVVNNTSKESKNYISIGSDEEFHELLNACPSDDDITFGIIPGSGHSKIADLIGLNKSGQAYGVLARRKIKTLHLAQINQLKILTSIDFSFSEPAEFEIEIDHQLVLKLQAHALSIVNQELDLEAAHPLELNVFGSTTHTSPSDSKPIIRLNNKKASSGRAHQQLVHLGANHISIHSSRQFTHPLLAEATKVLEIRRASQPIRVISKKHPELS